ncbi:MAG TPA: DUF5916 domain-containing protein [Gemmatimonadales bacterium]|nr:DUF5916 domain-containing protein [Gemmatimonadales bacterium]
MLASTVLLTVAVSLQSQAVAVASSPPSSPSATKASAVRAVRPPVLDGRDDDEVWRLAQPITEFWEFDPDEGKPARFATVAKVAYDAHNFYAFVRAFDPEPQKIQQILARRDVRPPTDQLKIVIDSYHDRRSGYEFAVSPSGVKRDYAVYNDVQEDDAWNGVWDVATTVDSLGWTAEFRIPLSQLRYANATTHTFGFAVWRDIERFKERVSWPLYHRNLNSFASQLGEVSGIDGISSPRRLEAAPYVVTKNVSVPVPSGFDRDQRITAGADFKYGVTSNLTLDGTINPDFGQVEADPAVLNLGAFETFFREQRPFFIEGAGLLTFNVNCNAVNDCGRENLFYSRRIGRAPQLSGLYGDATSPTASTILGAAKLTGRTPRGLSLGLIDAVTERQAGTGNRTIEPATNFAVMRATQDFRGGATVLGVIATGVTRANDQWSRGFLRSGALVGGVDLAHRFQRGRYEFDASVTASRVTGSPSAIAATQQNSTHYFQRPDGALQFDPTRTSLAGHTEQVRFGKIAGERLYFQTSVQRVSPGYEINDLGFLRRADWQEQATWAQVHWNKPTRVFQRLFWNFNEWNDWTTAGLPLEHAVNTNVHTELWNHWWLHAGGTLGQLGTAFCDRCTRGGPAFRASPYIAPWAGIEGDGRKVVVPLLWMNYWRGDEGRSSSLNLSPEIDLRVSSRWTASLALSATRNADNTQWTGNVTDAADVTHYTFAHLEQRTMSLQWRINFTATPNLTVQLYAEPFVSKGHYSNVRELSATPRAAAYLDRFQPYADPTVAQDFNVKQFRSNMVLRWEYKPGSTIYLVWSQGREDFEPNYGTRSFRGDFDELFHQHPDNTFLVKVSHWFDW